MYRHIGGHSWDILQYVKLKKITRWVLQIEYLHGFQA